MLHHQGKKPMPILAATPLFHLQSDCRGYKKRPRTATDCTGRHCPYSKWIISSERFLMCLVYRKLYLIATDILWTMYKIWNTIYFGNIAQMPDKSQFSAGSYFFTQKIAKIRKRHADTSFFSTEAKNSVSIPFPIFYRDFMWFSIKNVRKKGEIPYKCHFSVMFLTNEKK